MIKLAKRIIAYVFGKGTGGETIRYIFVGGMTSLVNIGLFALMNDILDINYRISYVTSISISILFAYIMNKHLVFRQRTDTLKALALEFVKFVGSRLFTFALQIGGVELFAYLRWSETLGMILSNILVIIVNYFISKLIVFRSDKK